MSPRNMCQRGWKRGISWTSADNHPVCAVSERILFLNGRDLKQMLRSLLSGADGVVANYSGLEAAAGACTARAASTGFEVGRRRRRGRNVGLNRSGSGTDDCQRALVGTEKS